MKRSWLLLTLALGLPVAFAQDGALPSRAEIAGKLKGVGESDLQDSTLTGFYEVTVGSRPK